jgi:predicted PurR-regulated permease PerM
LNREYPFYIRATVILFGLILIVYTLFSLRDIFVPLGFAILIAMLLNPLTNLFVGWGVHKVLAICLVIVLGFIVISLISYFIMTEIAGFTDQLPAFKDKFELLLKKSQTGIRQQFNIPLQKQNQYLSELTANMKPLIGATAGSVLGTLATIILLPVYTFLFLYYKTLLLDFLFEIFSRENVKEVNVVLIQTRLAIQNYMWGLLLEALIVAAMNSIALMILGVEYAVLLGVVGALLNILPFIGGILSAALPVLMATLTLNGFHTQVWIILSYMLIQFIDNHFLVPYIVSSRVKINALISIVIVLLGGAIWGVAGMFLSIPFVGVLKIIFDRIPELKPWGKLLGTEIPARHKGQIWMRFQKQKNVS